jgi:uncharacterized protein (DUF1697 family)
MTSYIALLRAVNVGGTGKLPMADLKRLCLELGFSPVQTYIASGNVVFQSALSAVQVKQALEAKLLDYAGKAVGVLIRTADEMREVLERNPFPDGAPNRVMALFLDDAPSNGAILKLKGQAAEVLALGVREIYIHYGDGMASSKLQIPAAKSGTARNMNTVAKLAEMASAT